MSSVIFRVPSAGGTPGPLTQLDGAKFELTHRWPQFLPGGKALLFTAHKQLSDFDEAAIELLSLPDGRRKTLHQGATFARYLPSGHIVFVNKGTLFALPFDLRRLESVGAVFPALEEAVYSSVTGGAQFDVSRNGTVVYLAGKSDVSGLTVQWLDASGSLKPLLTKPGSYTNPSLSPDGTRPALAVMDAASQDIWIYDWKHDTMSPLTFGAGAIHPAWFPDGRHLVYRGNDGMFWIRAAWGNSISPVEGVPEQWGLGKSERIPNTKSEVYVRAFPGHGREMADFECGRLHAGFVARGARTVLPHRRRQPDHGGSL